MWIGDWLRSLARKSPINTPVATVEAPGKEKSTVTDNMMSNLVLAEAIYTNSPPWLFDVDEGDPPLTPSGLGPIIATELATITTIEAKITEQTDPEINALIQDFVMPNLRQEIEKGWALGGLVFIPYYNDAVFTLDNSNVITSIAGNLKIGFLYPSQYIIEDYDHSGEVLKIKFFAVHTKDGKYYTKVETHDYDEMDRTLTITNVVYETIVPPMKFKWDNLGTVQVPLTTVDKWANILPKMVFPDVDGCLLGLYRPAIANNFDFNSPYGLSPLVRAANSLRRIDITINSMDWEMESSLARLFVDERAVATDDRIPKKLAKYVVRILGDSGGDKKFFEKFSPEIRNESYTKVINTYMRQIEATVGLAHGTISEQADTQRTATEIGKSRQRTFATVVDNQKMIEIAVRQLARAIQVWLYPNQVREAPRLVFDWDDSIVANPAEQLALYMLLQNAGNIPPWKTNMMYFNMTEEDAKDLWLQGQQILIDTTLTTTDEDKEDRESTTTNSASGALPIKNTPNQPTDTELGVSGSGNVRTNVVS